MAIHSFPGALLQIRDGVVARNFGLNRFSQADYGRGFQEMLAAAKPGDSLVCGPLQASLPGAVLAASNVRLVCTETVLVPSGAHVALLKVTGSDCLVSGLTCDGLAQANTSTGPMPRLS